MFDSLSAGESIQNRITYAETEPECECSVLIFLNNRTDVENTPRFCLNRLNSTYVKVPLMSLIFLGY